MLVKARVLEEKRIESERMYMDALRVEVRNSELKITKDKRAFLCYPLEGLVSCTIEEAEEGVVFLFDQEATEGKLESARGILKKTKEEKLRFLINSSKLLSLYDEYDFSLSPDNLLVDINLVPKVLLRDARDSESSDFISRYKALIGSILKSTYKYDDYIEGGEDLFKKDKFLSKIKALDSVIEIEELLLEEYKRTIETVKQTKKLVSKKLMIFLKVAIPLLLVIVGLSAFVLYQVMTNDIPYGKSMIEARNAYINNQPLEVQRVLRDYDIHELSYETKYILARSYVITEVLTVEQIADILHGLTLRTEEMIFDYWIHLGRLEFEEAIDIALRFNDNELLLFAYLKYEVAVRDDPTIGGDERINLLNRIESRINSLLQGREDALEQMLEEALIEALEEQEDEASEEQEEQEELDEPGELEEQEDEDNEEV